MTIPQSLMADDTIGPSLIESLKAIRKRLDRLGDQRVGGLKWAAHEGKANPRMLPDVDVGVWYRMATVVPEEGAPFQSSGFLALWEVQVLLKDSGKDKYGFAQATSLAVFAGVIRAFTETFGDVSLDETVDDVEFVGAESEIGSIAGGDRDMQEWKIRFRVRHPLLQHDR